MLVSFFIQIFETLLLVIKSEGEKQEKAIKEAFEKLQVLEEGVKSFPEGISFINHGNVGLLDIVFISMFGRYKVQEEVLGVKFDLEKFPLIFSWLTALLELPVVEEGLTPHEKLVGFLKYVRQNALNSTSV